ncbi:uncharacterized protein [Physcomitrium patens]|nr:E3 ubiquitin-protein ligase SHPRH-like isoform X3 [Physcomitrium patens]|eukprot:XP_024403200.1 E3 ubiquitin-protein ligase SHPRH-like isoform X3 [Physcomitrella patens]
MTIGKLKRCSTVGRNSTLVLILPHFMKQYCRAELDMDFPELVTELRPYQRRAAYWMVQREVGSGAIDNLDESSNASTSGMKTTRGVEHPLWVPVDSLTGQSKFFYNPYSGYVSMDPHDFQTDVRGGILADEMGLGKTVELLACILAHRASKETLLKVTESANRARETLMKYKCERIDCSCGATRDDEYYDGSWVQCDHCDAWQHALCVGYACPTDIDANLRRIAAQAQQVKKDEKVRLGKRVLEANGMPVNIAARERKGKRSRNVHRSEGQRSNVDSSVSKRNEETFICGTCAEMIGRVEIEEECGATLVVCPTPILRQWQDEISRHVRPGTLRVLVYEGVQKGATVVSGKGSLESSKVEKIKTVGAHDLATADLVLTTYDTLRADVSHAATASHKIVRSFRQPKRYPVVPTALTRLKWWRLCLDEAQMVESVLARATEMAMTLRTTHRWCVTGTPIQRGLDDLYGLLRFLRAEPFDNKRWWTVVLKEPYEEGKYGAVRAMHDLFRGLMWRSTKAQVADELGLPPQDERLDWLRFSPIEAHFYRQQHERCAVRAREVIANYRKHLSTRSYGRRSRARKSFGTHTSLEIPTSVTSDVASDLSSTRNSQHVQDGDLGMKAPSEELEDRLLSNKEAEKLLDQLRCLRQACVHPQVGSAGIRSLQRSPMTMDEILEVLVDKAKLEAEDAQRSLFGALNGLAGLAIIDNNIPLAVSIYREVLSYTEENAQDIRVDPLQKLHTLYNLAEVLEVKSQTGGADHKESDAAISNSGRSQAGENKIRSDVPRTLRDDLLLKQCEDIKTKYLAPFYAKLAAVQADFQSATKQVQEAKADLSDGRSAWWMEVLSSLEQQPDNGKDFIRKVRDHLLENDHLGEAGNMGRVKHHNISSIALRFQDVSGLKMVLLRELEAMEDGREELLQRLTDLGAKMENPDIFDVERAGNCSRCQPDMKGPACAHCEAEELFQAYENRLFFLKVTGTGEVAVSAEDALIAQHASLALKRRESSHKDAPVEVLERRARNRGVTSAQVTRAPSGTERILTTLRGQVGRDKLPAARKHLQLLEAMRKEFAQAKVLALAQREVFFEVHELNMATTRLRLRYPGEKIPNISVLHPEQVPQQNVHLTAEKFAALEELNRVKGQLRYLNGVKSARQKVERGESAKTMIPSESSISVSKPVESNEEECPICHEILGSRFMVLPCGHVLCCKCMLSLVERSTLPQSQKKINCPSCRRRTNVSEVAYVVNTHEKEGLDPTIAHFQGGEKEDVDFASSVKGSYGTKLEAVLRRILRLKSEDPDMKVLLFSEWQGVLDVVEHALKTNHITFTRVKRGGQINDAIDRFRGVEETVGKKRSSRKRANVDEVQGPVQVLLMPIRHGANGLNLVEAQHVMLLEPLLNPAMEAQAINRVHRIGQTRATFVHRFIVHDTVEESIYGLRRQKAMNLPGGATGKSDVYNLTLKDLSSLFSIQTGVASNSAQVQPSAIAASSGSLTPARAAAAAAEARLMLRLEP